MKQNLWNNTKPLIGMIHLPPLPGYPNHPGMDMVIQKALTDLKTLEDAGYSGALVENDNDQPHFIGVPEYIAESFAIVMHKILAISSIPVGMEIIYDMKKTIMIASEVGAPFVRLDVYVDTVKTKYGIVQKCADEIQQLLHDLDNNKLQLITDIQVKHAEMVEKKSLTKSATEAIYYKSDGLIVTGSWTGIAPNKQDLIQVKKIAANSPVFIGSGFTPENAHILWSLIDGAIVGTSIKTHEYIDFEKAKQLIKLIKLL